MAKSKAVNAGSWVLLGLIISQCLRLGSNLFLTRFLAPDAFGLMAVAFSLIAGINMLSDIGIQANIVQSRRGEDPTFLRTAWTVQIIRGLVIATGVALLGTALWACQVNQVTSANSVYSDPDLPLIMLSLAILPIMNGFLSINFHVAERQINQKKRVFLELISTAAPIPLMMSIVLIEPTLWALVAGTIFGEFLRASLSHVLFKGKENRILFDKQSIRELIHFGKWIMLSSLLGFLALQGDKLLLGGLLTPAQLGWYAIATLFIAAAEQIVYRLHSSVAFPLIADQSRQNADTFINSYYKFRFYTDPVVILIATTLLIIGDDIINLLYTEQYAGAGWMLQILALRLLLLIYSLQGQVFLAQGQPKVLSSLIFLRVVAMFTLLPLAFHFAGIEYAILTVGLAAIPAILYSFVKFYRNGWLRIKKELLVIPMTIIGVGIGFVVEMIFHQVIRLLGL